MNNEIWVILLIVVVAGFTYWDYKRVKNMVLPPPPKPAPLRPPVEATSDDIDGPVQGVILDWERPESTMTGHEWAQVKVLIAAAQLDTASLIGAWIVVIVFALIASLWPEKWWIYVPVLLFGNIAIRWPFEKALENATDYMENSNFRW